MPMTFEQREELRRAMDKSRREALEESRRLAALQPAAKQTAADVAREKPAERAARVHEDRLIARQLIGETPRAKSRCCFCGAPAKDGVCHAHSDLLGDVA